MKKDPNRKLKEKYYSKGIQDYPHYCPPYSNEIPELLSGKLSYETMLTIYRIAWKKKERAVKENPFPCCIECEPGLHKHP